MYAVSKTKPFYYTLILLNMFVWYPLKNDKGYMKLFFCLSGVLRMMSLLCSLGTLTHLILAVRNNTGIDISEDIGDLTGFVGCLTTCLAFLSCHSKWSQLFNDLLDFKHFGKPPKYDKIVKRGNLISLFCLLYAVPGFLWYCYVSYMKVPECRDNNMKMNLKEPCGMINPTWMPMKSTEGTPFILCYVFQFIGIFVYLSPTFAICIIPWEAVEVIVTRINHLKEIFKDVFESHNRKIRLRQLHYCIAYHQDILKISEELSGLVRLTNGSFILTAATVIGALGTQLLKESTPKAVLFVMAYITAFFFICHAGQRLIDESADLSNYVYDSMWYEMDAKVKKDVMFVLARCQKPSKLAGPPAMGSMSYLLFCIMIKTSYSYLTLLNQMV